MLFGLENMITVHLLSYQNCIKYSLFVKYHGSAMCVLSCVCLFATSWSVVTRLLCPGNSPGKNTGVGCHFPLQGVFQTQGWNLRLLD